MIAISPESRFHRSHSVCLLTGRTAYKYHLFTFHITPVAVLFKTGARGRRNVLKPISRPNVLETDPGNWFGEENLFFPQIFDNLQWPVTVFPGSVCFPGPVARKRCMNGHGRLISKYSIAADICCKCYAATTDTVVLMLLTYR